MKYSLIKNYKYRVEETEFFKTGIYGHYYDGKYFKLDTDGVIVIRPGYCWDGASGPTWDSKSSMRASLIHDVLYQLMRIGVLDAKIHKNTADLILYKICVEDGMWEWRANLWYAALTKFGWGASKLTDEPEVKILVAP